MHVYCLWMGEGGYGGPRITPDVMRGLAELDLEVWFDVGFLANQNAIAHNPAS